MGTLPAPPPREQGPRGPPWGRAGDGDPCQPPGQQRGQGIPAGLGQVPCQPPGTRPRRSPRGRVVRPVPAPAHRGRERFPAGIPVGSGCPGPPRPVRSGAEPCRAVGPSPGRCRAVPCRAGAERSGAERGRAGGGEAGRGGPGRARALPPGRAGLPEGRRRYTQPGGDGGTRGKHTVPRFPEGPLGTPGGRARVGTVPKRDTGERRRPPVRTPARCLGGPAPTGWPSEGPQG